MLYRFVIAESTACPGCLRSGVRPAEGRGMYEVVIAAWVRSAGLGAWGRNARCMGGRHWQPFGLRGLWGWFPGVAVAEPTATPGYGRSGLRPAEGERALKLCHFNAGGTFRLLMIRRSACRGGTCSAGLPLQSRRHVPVVFDQAFGLQRGEGCVGVEGVVRGRGDRAAGARMACGGRGRGSVVVGIRPAWRRRRRRRRRTRRRGRGCRGRPSSPWGR